LGGPAFCSSVGRAHAHSNSLLKVPETKRGAVSEGETIEREVKASQKRESPAESRPRSCLQETVLFVSKGH